MEGCKQSLSAFFQQYCLSMWITYFLKTKFVNGLCEENLSPMPFSMAKIFQNS